MQDVATQVLAAICRVVLIREVATPVLAAIYRGVLIREVATPVLAAIHRVVLIREVATPVEAAIHRASCRGGDRVFTRHLHRLRDQWVAVIGYRVSV